LQFDNEKSLKKLLYYTRVDGVFQYGDIDFLLV